MSINSTSLPSPLEVNDLKRVFKHALAEDIGTGDLTCQTIIPKELTGDYTFVTREPCTLCGIPVLDFFYREFYPKIHFTAQHQDGSQLPEKTIIATISGSLPDILSSERVVLNLLQHLSGIATHTARYAAKIAGTSAILLDTRKTTPGLRRLEKYATKTGGAQNHRMGLYDAIMVKDNHLALGGGIQKIMEKIHQWEHSTKCNVPIIIECETETAVSQAISCGAKHILLDNMSPATIKSIASKYTKSGIVFEASGGIKLDTIATYAHTDIQYISVGALTQSAKSIDIGLDEIKHSPS